MPLDSSINLFNLTYFYKDILFSLSSNGVMMIELSVLGSGSKGNSTLVSDGTFSFLIDAGFSGRELDRRMTLHEKSIDELRAVLITHDHGDHINGAGVVARKTGAPVYIHQKTEKKIRRRLGKRVNFEFMEPEEPFTLGSMTITSFEAPHDAIHSCGFVIEQNDYRIGFVTDLGHPSATVVEALRNCHAIVLESNHDEQMLLTGPYPQVLKDRVVSDEGHLSNEDCGKILKEIVHDGLELVILVHLSEENNDRDIVQKTAEEALAGCDCELIISSQYEPTDLFVLGEVGE